jgi:hypothetical protein
MPDVTFQSRELDYASDDIKIKFRHNGTVATYTKAQIEADPTLETAILTVLDPDAASVKSLRTAYKRDGSSRILDTDAGLYQVNETWKQGKELDYATTDYNGGIVFLDLGEEDEGGSE